MFEETTTEVDGERRPFHDALLDGLVGAWRVLGKIAGQEIEQYCESAWVLSHQFLRVYFVDSKTKRLRDDENRQEPAEYEAMVFIGYDNMSERYVVHWLDVFGGKFSEP